MSEFTYDQALALASKKLDANRPEAAEQICRQVLNQLPDDLPFLFVSTAALVETGRLKAATAQVERVLAHAPDHPQVEILLANVRAVEQIWREQPYFQEFVINQSRHLDFPRYIGIETVGYCNANCFFCPHETLERKQVAMSDALFEKLIGDLMEIPEDLPLHIIPNFVNEPFMDKNLINRLIRINQALPRAGIHLFTNFNVPLKDKLEQLAGVQNLKKVNVSLNSANTEEYRAMMSIDIERTWDNIRSYLTFSQTRRIAQEPLVLSRLAQGTPRDNMFEEECRHALKDFEYGEEYLCHVKNQTNWLSGTENGQNGIPYALPCNAWFDINIMCTGVVPFCCMDGKGEHVLGDVNHNSLVEIYNNKTLRRMRETESSREGLAPCDDCSLMQ